MAGLATEQGYDIALQRIKECSVKNQPYLNLSGLSLTTLPRGIGELKKLHGLSLDMNSFTSLPQEIFELKQLRSLNLARNRLTTIPPEISAFAALQYLDVNGNFLRTLPPEIGQLKSLLSIVAHRNQLASLPPEIGDLTGLVTLFLHVNRLRTIPKEIGKLVNLKRLELDNNELRSLPPEIGRLRALKRLALYENKLTSLPAEIGGLVNVKRLPISSNPLQDPPLPIARQGIRAINRYFADKADSGIETLWRSKLMLVGQGRVGKTELRNRFMNRPHGEAKTTEVVEIETLSLRHPKAPGITMELRCWDFGGQDIYHATHQFFLTGRSVFLFCFEAGKDWEAGKPYYWLDKISAVAPDAPIVVVATKCDERPAPSLPWDDLKKRYPQLIGDGCITITTKASNRKDKLGDGIAELINCLQVLAVDHKRLPLMGLDLPRPWARAIDLVTGHPKEHYLTRAAFSRLLEQAGVRPESHQSVALVLRDLGEILYYSEEKDGMLRDWVIIKPTWVTHAAACVLDSLDVQANDGILTQHEMSKAWTEYPLEMHPVLLDLLEKYDLTYKIPDDPQDRSLVVERLPKNPADPPEFWTQLKPLSDTPNREMSMTFHLGSMQAGIPTWFIARKHYHTLRRHWLYGVYFADDRKEPRHIALIRASTDPKNPVVTLVVRGPFPQTFFAVMKEGLEASIRDRYPKLIENQTIPCTCQDRISGENRCRHQWDLRTLEQMYEASVSIVRCHQKPFEEVTIRQLLSGYDDPVTSMESALHEMELRIINRVEEVGDRLDHLAQQERENFRYLFNDLQAREESHCPNYFLLWKAEPGKPFHVPMRLALVCQHPKAEHAACSADQAYRIEAFNHKLQAAAPLLRRVATFLKYAKLAGLPLAKQWEKEIAEILDDVDSSVQTMLMDFEVVARSGESPGLVTDDFEKSGGDLVEKRIAGSALREFRALLDKLDPQQKWQGLTKKRSKSTGDFLWVCEEHARDSDYLP
jgi:internalin A